MARSGQPRCDVRVHRADARPIQEPAQPWARAFVDMAQLSAIVYRKLPDNLPAPAGWTPSPDPRDVVDDARTSLYFEVWERIGPDAVDVAVVFRGTHEWKDWWSNARWITRFVPIGWDQYDLARREIGGVVGRARARHPAARVMTAGHSLGGGLAQQAAYASPDVKLVVAFDSSPVTGFRAVPPRARAVNRRGITINRVFEHGEILAYLRTLIRRFLPLSRADPSITEVRFNLRHGDPIQQHSMVDLAKRMAWAARECPDPAAAARRGRVTDG